MAYIREYSGRIYIDINNGYIRHFVGRIDYKIDGYLSHKELMFALTVQFEEGY